MSSGSMRAGGISIRREKVFVTANVAIPNRAVKRARLILITLRGASSVLSSPISDTLAAAEEGKMGPVLNIASPGSRCRDLRFFPQCVAEFAMGQEPKLTIDEAVEQLVPGDRLQVSNSELQTMLNVKADTMRSRGRGALRIARKGTPGKLGVQRYTADSVRKWLRGILL